MTWSRVFFQRDQLHGQLWMIQDKLNWLVSLFWIKKWKVSNMEYFLFTCNVWILPLYSIVKLVISIPLSLNFTQI